MQGPQPVHAETVSRLLEALPSGSYLTVSDTTSDIDPGRVTGAASRLNAGMGPTQLTLRTREEFARYFDGLDLVEPGIVSLPQWRALYSPKSAEPIPAYGCVGRKL
ncbi:MAG: SAM-dependent methyltransferase [Actinomycetota bacterium]